MGGERGERSMLIEKEKQEKKLILKLSGRLETATAPMLQEMIEKEQEDVTELKLDMENLEYVSSAGLRVLLAATKKMNAKGGSMVVYHVNEAVMEVFEITGFNEILNIQ